MTEAELALLLRSLPSAWTAAVVNYASVRYDHDSGCLEVRYRPPRRQNTGDDSDRG